MDDPLVADLDGLRALARRVALGDGDADDLVQDAAVVALTHPPARDRALGPWLATVIRNLGRMDRRSRRRRERREAAAPLPAAGERADQLLDRARTLERLAQALVALDEPFRHTVVRRYIDGWSAVQIARADGIPDGTVRWRLKTGLARLRAALDHHSPRATWLAALGPLGVPAGGVLAVKTKSWIAIAIILALLAGGAALVVRGRGQGDPGPATAPPAPGATARGSAAAPTAGPASSPAPAPPPALAAPATSERATVEQVALPGGAISGRVINWSTGDGVASAELTFTGPDGAVTVRSDGAGAFELAPPAPGAFALAAASAPGFLPYAPAWSHSTVAASLVRDHRVRGFTVFLFPALDYHGTVVDEAGAPVPGARVRLLGTPAGEQDSDHDATEWIADRAGAFVFHAADDAVLEASAGRAHGWARLDGAVAITRQLVIHIAAAPARDATIRGRVVDGDGQPVIDALIRSAPAGDEVPGAPPRSPAAATSGPDGSFALTGLDRARYDLVATVDDHAPARATATGGQSGVTLTLADGLPLAGTVRSSDGAVIPVFTLLVFREQGAARELVVERSIIDAGGRFAIRVAPGAYRLVASSPAWAPSPPTAAQAGSTDVALTVTTGATIRGRVLSDADGSPLAYARVMREASGGGASARPANAGTVTRLDGTFELTGVPAGPVALTFAAGDFHRRIEAGITATDGAVIGPIEVRLTPLKPGETPTLELVGVGLQLVADGDVLRVVTVIPGGGAEAAGIVAGDGVVAVDGVAVTETGLEGAIARIRGTPGTSIVLLVRRSGRETPFTVERRRLKT